MRNFYARKVAAVVLCCTISMACHAQFLMDMIDTTKDMGKGLLSVYKKFDHLRIGAYMQPQFQLATDSAITSFAGGNFPAHSNNRFMLRRGRVRFDYIHFAKKGDGPSVQFALQFDGTERGVNIRDMWGRLMENNWQLFSVTAGMFARPFGYEVNLSSSDREAPERGRMSQILMRTERDLGGMLSFEPRKKDHPLKKLKIDAGLFNGQGLAGPNEFDRYKDFIGQVLWRPTEIIPGLQLSGGISFLSGGLRQNTRYRFQTENKGNMVVLPDSTHAAGSKIPRRYAGANLQLKQKHGWGFTELRAEYWQGTQTGTQQLSETPGAPSVNDNYYVRKFSGGFFVFLQNIINAKNQLIVKYDFYDPNTRVKKAAISDANKFTAADIKYNTLGVGFLRHISENVKLVLFYDMVRNEHTLVTGYEDDVKDDVFTCRLQFRFF